VPDVLSALRDHLIAQGIVRKPSVAGSAPPLWIEPKDGVPAPGEGAGTEVGSDLVLGAYYVNEIAPGRFESWWEKPIIELRLRARVVPPVKVTERAISKALIDKVDWTMSGLYVNESELFNGLHRLGSDDQSYDFGVSYVFQLYRP
jgi:hypothetical protein